MIWQKNWPHDPKFLTESAPITRRPAWRGDFPSTCRSVCWSSASWEKAPLGWQRWPNLCRKPLSRSFSHPLVQSCLFLLQKQEVKSLWRICFAARWLHYYDWPPLSYMIWIRETFGFFSVENEHMRVYFWWFPVGKHLYFIFAILEIPEETNVFCFAVVADI